MTSTPSPEQPEHEEARRLAEKARLALAVPAVDKYRHSFVHDLARDALAVLALVSKAEQERDDERSRCIEIVQRLRDEQVDPIGYETCNEVLRALSASAEGPPA